MIRHSASWRSGRSGYNRMDSCGVFKRSNVTWRGNSQCSIKLVKPLLYQLTTTKTQQLRHNLESSRAQLASVKAASSDRFEVNRELILVREAESRLSACEAQIAANSVISLHHQLKAERDVTRREQLEELKKAQV